MFSVLVDFHCKENDGTTAAYLIQISLAKKQTPDQMTLLTGGKKFMYAYEGSRKSYASMLL